MARIVELITYPIKGCAGTSVPDMALTSAGLAHDRSFMVVDGDGVFRSQRRDPRMAVIRPDSGAPGEQLTLHAPGIAAMHLDVDTEGPRREVLLFGAPFRGIDQGDEVSAWLTDVLGVSSRLVRVPPEHERVTSGVFPGTCGYADSGATLLVSRSSLDELNSRIPCGAPPMDRFRPNIVVDGWDEPHVEDRARRIVVGDAEFGYAKLDIRCAVTTVDQATGTKAGPEPLRTLATYRRAAAGGVAFGAKFSVLRAGQLSVGDELDVTAWGESELGRRPRRPSGAYCSAARARRIET